MSAERIDMAIHRKTIASELEELRVPVIQVDIQEKLIGVQDVRLGEFNARACPNGEVLEERKILPDPVIYDQNRALIRGLRDAVDYQLAAQSVVIADEAGPGVILRFTVEYVPELEFGAAVNVLPRVRDDAVDRVQVPTERELVEVRIRPPHKGQTRHRHDRRCQSSRSITDDAYPFLPACPVKSLSLCSTK